MFKLLTILPCLIFMFQPLNAKVEVTNYDFSLETLSFFLPESSISSATEKFGRPELMNNVSGAQTQKFYVAQIRYKFPVLVQVREDKILDFFARLPSYFLHDGFLQSLVNKLGKQNSYKKIREEAFYIWEKDNLKHIYSAACTITCFPIFYSVYPLTIPPEKSFTPLIKQMIKAWK